MKDGVMDEGMALEMLLLRRVLTLTRQGTFHRSWI